MDSTRQAKTDTHPYCISRYYAQRILTREVRIGNTAVGGENPIRIQSMTTPPTQDIQATVKQSLALAEAGCEIIRITAPNKKAAQALGPIAQALKDAHCHVPLVADIHFLPSAAMEAAKHVDKVRINPGNYADNKKFAVKEYTDSAYAQELERLHEVFTPIVLRCKELGRAMRIGTNHGSLSDRIMNRYGDTPHGMVESALEFIRIAESHNYHDICLSLKASNPKVMIEAYRLAVSKMHTHGMNYPLHLGVTEAGDGEDARIKSAIGIGTLLNDGIGDTIRVSLTEDPVHEIPVAQALAQKAMKLWSKNPQKQDTPLSTNPDQIDPYSFTRNLTQPIELNSLKDSSNQTATYAIGATHPPRIVIKAHHPLEDYATLIQTICKHQIQAKENKLEGLLLEINTPQDLEHFTQLHQALETIIPFFVLDLSPEIDLEHLENAELPKTPNALILTQTLDKTDAHYATQLLKFCRDHQQLFALNAQAQDIENSIGPILSKMGTDNLILTTQANSESAQPFIHPTGHYRALLQTAKTHFPNTPIWIRNTHSNSIAPEDYFSDRLLESSILTGNLLCDGIGDLISIENEPNLEQAIPLAYNILQGARARITKTEFVACPSCGRTLFDLQSVTQLIRAKTDHLKGVTIAIMGCIVNGPGEMADADFGYVGGAPDKINLYIGKTCVEYNVPADQALDRLIDLIKQESKWVDPV
ncbi:MAG: 4-hydroxy-3-methylbut-2-en-1-yl diphosphate synthase [Opitutales bacterium TMED207]|nr:4-hydroxy-3-methylbut-2-en-1-yl diphosphate synthase [Puniceicoccaceae bacterium]RPG15288.1 MAG: 4-hydroxy-3-methylbut-2-en-1-yl diphosphate synthase [Opitutales bacterium TMED207]